MGTPEFAVPSLRALHAMHDVAAVVTKPDARAGRGLHLTSSPVKTAALELGLPVLEPEHPGDPAFVRELKQLGADLFFVVAFRILPPAVFMIPPKGTVNLHGSLLPDYRGAAPIQRAVMNGDESTGLTTFFIQESVDTGDIILAEKVPIGPDETAGELAARMSVLGAALAVRTAGLIESGSAPRIPQPMTGGRPAPKIRKEEGRIDWTRDARSIHNLVRGMNPEPGAFTHWSRGLLGILRTRPVEGSGHGKPGTVAEASPSAGFSIRCGSGALEVLEVRPAGKRPMDGAAFVRGYRIAPGMTL